MQVGRGGGGGDKVVRWKNVGIDCGKNRTDIIDSRMQDCPQVACVFPECPRRAHDVDGSPFVYSPPPLPPAHGPPKISSHLSAKKNLGRPQTLFPPSPFCISRHQFAPRALAKRIKKISRHGAAILLARHLDILAHALRRLGPTAAHGPTAPAPVATACNHLDDCSL